MSRIADACKWLAAELSCTRDEFCRRHREGADMLLTALLTGSYAREQRGRIGLTDIGRRLVEAERPLQYAE